MKFFQILITALLFFVNSAFAAHQLYADSDNISIPYGTKFELSMAHDLTTRNVVQGDIFDAYNKINV